MKLAADRTKDKADAEWMIAAGVVDLKRGREIVKKHLGAYAARSLDALVSEIEWKKSRGMA